MNTSSLATQGLRKILEKKWSRGCKPDPSILLPPALQLCIPEHRSYEASELQLLQSLAVPSGVVSMEKLSRVPFYSPAWQPASEEVVAWSRSPGLKLWLLPLWPLSEPKV